MSGLKFLICVCVWYIEGVNRSFKGIGAFPPAGSSPFSGTKLVTMRMGWGEADLAPPLPERLTYKSPPVSG